MTAAPARPADVATATVAAVERRVLWLATAIVHHANRVRSDPSGLKVGGHQASSASMATIMTELWFRHLRRRGPGVGQAARVAGAARDQPPARGAGPGVPHRRCASSAACSPTRAGRRTPTRSTTRRARSGSARPRRSGARWRGVRRAVRRDAGTGRQYSLVGDAELDEGACWEAMLDPMVGELGEVVWVVDLNRQCLDRVVPIMGATRLQGMFAAAGWQVLTVKYGSLLEELFTRPGGPALRARIDEMSNPEYQRLLRCTDAQLRERLPGDDPAVRALVDSLDDADVARRDPQPRRARPRRARRGLRRHRRHPADGDLRLHREGARAGHRGPPAEPLVAAHRRAARAARRASSAPTRTTRGRRSRPARRRRRCAPRSRAAAPGARPAAPPPDVPADLGRTPSGTATTQAALGRALLDLVRGGPRRRGRGSSRSPRTSARRPTWAAG